MRHTRNHIAPQEILHGVGHAQARHQRHDGAGDHRLYHAQPGRDWILTRILWLSGCEPGRNRLGPVDTMRRYIYLHGTPDAVDMTRPGSHGCVRMRNRDIAELFDRVAPGTPVEIVEHAE